MCCNRDDDDDHNKRGQNHQDLEDDGNCGKTGAAVRILGGSIATPGAWGWAASLREHFSTYSRVLGKRTIRCNDVFQLS